MKCIRKNTVKQEEKYDGPQRRSHYRIEYPITERPLLIMGDGEEYEVIDICEGGVKFFYHAGKVFLPLQSVKGKIRYHDDAEEEIEGRVLRANDDFVVVQLTQKKIPYKRIVKEQFYFRKKPECP
ncbi:MAG: PilZ domain-containing protein [Phycisphaerae bacterium]|jgi:hypothetical protein|nr:PilZ domain-containing protein [Phycisphaerae bacterium]